jgi:hypothetical protein
MPASIPPLDGVDPAPVACDPLKPESLVAPPHAGRRTLPEAIESTQ